MYDRRLFEFWKTDHCLEQQWKRGIDDSILKKVIPHIKNEVCKKKVIIVDKAFLRKKEIECKARKLIIVIKENCLATTYWMDYKGSEKLKLKEEKNRAFVQLI